MSDDGGVSSDVTDEELNRLLQLGKDTLALGFGRDVVKMPAATLVRLVTALRASRAREAEMQGQQDPMRVAMRDKRDAERFRADAAEKRVAELAAEVERLSETNRLRQSMLDMWAQSEAELKATLFAAQQALITEGMARDAADTKVTELTTALKASRQLVEDAALRGLDVVNRAQAAEAKVRRYREALIVQVVGDTHVPFFSCHDCGGIGDTRDEVDHLGGCALVDDAAPPPSKR